MYRDDDSARAERATSLIGEIADLERQKVTLSTTEQKLEAAKRELAALQVNPGPPPGQPEKPPGLVAHLLVFGGTAAAAFLGYTLLL
jgi:hypothetical protein